MRHVLAFVIIVASASPVVAQARKPVRKPAPPVAAALKKVAPEMSCPAPLGLGVKTRLSFCEVLSGRDPAGGLIIQIPPHKGPATLTFDLHNIQTYSDEEVKARRAYTKSTATIGTPAARAVAISMPESPTMTACCRSPPAARMVRRRISGSGF